MLRTSSWATCRPSTPRRARRSGVGPRTRVRPAVPWRRPAAGVPGWWHQQRVPCLRCQTGKVLWSGQTQAAVLARTDHLRTGRQAIPGGERGWRGTGRRLLRAQPLAHAGVRAGRYREAAPGAAVYAARPVATTGHRLGTGSESRASSSTPATALPCHGDRGQTRGANFPDLTRTPLLWSQEGFDSIVLKGLLAERGMASFAEALKPHDTALIAGSSSTKANQLKNSPQPAAPPPAAVGAHEQH